MAVLQNSNTIETIAQAFGLSTKGIQSISLNFKANEVASLNVSYFDPNELATLDVIHYFMQGSDFSVFKDLIISGQVDNGRKTFDKVETIDITTPLSKLRLNAADLSN